MKYDLVIFDSDGTLANTLPWMRGIFNELARDHGFRSVDPDEYEHFRDLHGRELLRALRLPLWKLPRVIADMRRRMAASAESFEVFPGIPEALAQLHADGTRLAVVSSNSRENVGRILGPELSILIAHWACGASVFSKASRLRSVIRASRVPLANVVYVGDEIRDAVACKDAGIDFIAVTWGQHSAAALSQHAPAALAESPGDLARIVRDPRRVGRTVC